MALSSFKIKILKHYDYDMESSHVMNRVIVFA